jgi:hypothetical protein
LSDNNYSYEYDEEGNREQRNHLMGSGFDTYIWDQRNRLVAFDTWGPREWVQLPFESDTGGDVIDAIGNAPNGALFGDAQLVGESSPQEGGAIRASAGRGRRLRLDGDPGSV